MGSGHETNAGHSAAAAAGSTHVAGLLALAISQPAVALATGRRIVAGEDDRRTGARGVRAAQDDYDLSVAHHAVAIVERDRGHVAEALEAGRAALSHARRVGPERQAEVLATIGTTHLFAGETTRGLKVLDRAAHLSTGSARLRVHHLRACTYWLLGRQDEALADATSALDLARGADDPLWLGRVHGLMGDVLRAGGDVDGAAREYLEAESVLLGIGEVTEATLCAHNRALVSLNGGDVVAALTLMEEAADRLQSAGAELPMDQVVNHAEALVTARLGEEALAVTDAALARRDLAPVWRGDLLLASARAALVLDDWAGAAERAGRAEDVFRAHRRRRWALRAALLSAEAEWMTQRSRSRDSPILERLLARTGRVVRALRHLADPELPEALLLHAQLATAAGRKRLAASALEEAARRRDAGTPLARAAGWLATALLADQRGARRALRHACRRGLDAVDEHRSVMGDLELRALASGYGLDLATLALRDAVRARDARALLWWSERWRATSLAAGAPTAPDDAELARDVAALRDVTHRLADDRSDEGLHRERRRLETSVRSAYRRLHSEGAFAPDPDLDLLVERLGDTVLLSLVVIDERLHAVTVADGAFSLTALGRLDDVTREADFARFALRRAAHGRPVDIAAAAERLQTALLGDPDPRWSRRSVLIAPAAHLLTVPFGMLPALAGSEVTVTPSTTLWLRARDVRAETRQLGHVALVTGPGLTTHEQEVTQLRSVHPDAVVLGGADATVGRTLAALSGARLAHIAAHGTFRSDAPLFSSLQLADGPLMLHDLDRVPVPPQAFVLSACDSGGLHPITPHEALGLVSGLLAAGTHTVVASVEPVNDAATAALMPHVHAAVAAGGTLAAGLLNARREAGSDPLLAATAAAFVAWGA